MERGGKKEGLIIEVIEKVWCEIKTSTADESGNFVWWGEEEEIGNEKS